MDTAEHPGRRRCYQLGCQEPQCHQAQLNYLKKYRHRRRATDWTTWQRGEGGCIIDPLSGRDVSDVIDDVAICLHETGYRSASVGHLAGVKNDNTPLLVDGLTRLQTGS